ncbi:adenine nucleotide alpha hydrolases-like protein [Backusella circina FSU 941]|nr:adenine nucleotide alpha hydrolases-like protein [Backusella circina FSU 941]
MEVPNTIDQTLTRLPTTFFPVPHQNGHKGRTIVIAYDQSNYGDAVIAKAIQVGLISIQDDIRLLHIVSEADYRALFSPMANSGVHKEPLDSNMTAAADAFIGEIINVLKKHGFTKVSSEIQRGDPKESITDYCRISKPAYIVTGTRGFGHVKRAVMGSVSSYLVEHCPCPVLVVKLEHDEIEARKELDANKHTHLQHVFARFTKEHK